jgi:Flp pilus assembly pilin Flp
MMMRKNKINRKGQNLIEYAIVISVVSVAVIAMGTYVFRAVQGTQKAITEEFAND